MITGEELEKLIFEAGMGSGGGSLQEEKLAAKERLIRNGDERMVELIIEKLETPSTLLVDITKFPFVVIPAIARAMIEVFIEIGEAAVDPVIKALEKTGGTIGGCVYYNYARVLGEIGDERAVEPLTKALEDHFTVSNAAKEALKKLGHEVE